MNITNAAVEAVARELYEDYDENCITSWEDANAGKRDGWLATALRYLEIASEHSGSVDRLYSAGKWDE